MSAKSRLDHSLHAFAGELLSFAQRAEGSISSLKRCVEQKPQASIQDFKECLDDLDQQVADFTDEIQQLAACTADTTSLEELIGHCAAVYSSNRATALALEGHLEQYGYQRWPATQWEPDNPLKYVAEDHDARPSSDVGVGSRAYFTGNQHQHQQSQSTPTSPVEKFIVNGLRNSCISSRLGRSQPGSPLAAHGAAAANSNGLRQDEGQQKQQQGLVVGVACSQDAVMRTAYKQYQGHAPLTQGKPNRTSLGCSSSSALGAVIISPSVAALANKYATLSAGGTSVGDLSDMSTGVLTGHTKKPACRDLSLSFAMADANSPDLPVFGRIPASSNNQQQQQGLAGAFPALDSNEVQIGPQHVQPIASGQAAAKDWVSDSMLIAPVSGVAPAAPEGPGAKDEDSTGELYSSLIKSNINGTPPCTDSLSCPTSPQAPPTAGRLPAEWHNQKMQELEDLQADLTLTLSQMKRIPSKSRLAAAAELAALPAPTDRQQCSQSQPTDSSSAADADTSQHMPDIAAATAMGQVPRVWQSIKAVANATRPAAAATEQPAATAATAAATARPAATATADLDSLMASLSMKYALADTASTSKDCSASPELSTSTSTVCVADTEFCESTSGACGTMDVQEQLPAHAAMPGTDAENENLEAFPGSSGREQHRQQAAGALAVPLHGQPKLLQQQQPQQWQAHQDSDAAVEASSTVVGMSTVTTGPHALQSLQQPVAGRVNHDKPQSKADHSQQQQQQATGQQHHHHQQQQQQVEEALTPRATCLQRRLQLQQKLQQQQQQEDPMQKQQLRGSSVGTVLRSVENVTLPHGSVLSAHVKLGSEFGNSARQQSPGAAVQLPHVSQEEFNQLPGWCKGLLSVELLNGVLEELTELTAGRAGRHRSHGWEGFTAADLELLGHSSSRSKTIITALHKLTKAVLQKSAAGANVYRLT